MKPRADAVQSHMLQIARSIYSMPPDHGAAIAAKIFADPQLKQEWILELDAMRNADPGNACPIGGPARGGDWRMQPSISFERSAACFRCSACSPKAVERLREKHHIYMTADSRMNLAGIMPHNVAYVAEAFAAERGR